MTVEKSDLAGRKVSVLSPDEDFSSILSFRLNEKKLETNTFTNPKQMEDWISSEKSDCLLMDLNLKNFDPIEVVRSIREKFSSLQIPIILIVMNQNDPILLKAMDEGANDFLVKPFQFPLALVRIKNHILLKVFNLEMERNRLERVKASSRNTLLDIAGSVSHEINNPLTILSGNIQILQLMIQKGAFNTLEEKVKNDIVKKLNKVGEGVARIESVVHGFRLFIKDEISGEKAVINPGEVIKNVTKICLYTITVVGIEMRWDEKSVPPNCEVLIPQAFLMEVVFNLLKNAKNAVQDLKGSWIAIRIEVDGECSNIIIEDSGKIDNSTAKRIFEPFYSNSSDKMAGGMGLTISREIIENYSGSLYLDENHPNTKFVIKLPKCKVDNS